MKHGILSHIPGILLAMVLLSAECLFSVLLWYTKLIPVKYLLLLCVVLVLFTALVLFLNWNLKKTVRLVFGVLLTVLMTAGLLFAGSYVIKGLKTAAQITEITVEIADVGVYVLQDDPAQSVNDLEDYSFGILSELDRENTDKAVDEIETVLNKKLQVTEYPGLAELADSLVSQEVQAVVVNSAFVELLSDMEGYEVVETQLREVHVEQVETVLEHVVTQKLDTAEAAPDAEAGTWDVPDQETASENAVVNTVFSIYISGIDSRSGMIAKSRSDVNIVATVNTETRQILLVSTPRDFYVPLTISNGVPDKLTHAGIYGIEVSKGTLEMLYETEIDYYFRVNFSGFEGIVDALGGITVDSEVAFSVGDYSYQQGENYLNGAAALTFARERKSFASGDRQRGKNQMAVIKGVINAAISPALLTNFSGIMDSIAGSFETSMPYEEIAALVRKQLDQGGDWNVVTYSVDGTGASKKPYSLSTNAYVMVPDYDTVNTAIYMMEQVKNGEILEQQ